MAAPAEQEHDGEPGQDETLLQQIARTYYELLPAFERYMGMTGARWHLLKHLFQEGRISQAVLQQRLRVDAAAVTRQVKQLEQEALLTRCADPRDNRFTLVSLTPAGRELVAGLMGQRERFEQLMLQGIDGADVAALQRCLAHIRANTRALARLADPAQVARQSNMPTTEI